MTLFYFTHNYYNLIYYNTIFLEKNAIFVVRVFILAFLYFLVEYCVFFFFAVIVINSNC